MLLGVDNIEDLRTMNVDEMCGVLGTTNNPKGATLAVNTLMHQLGRQVTITETMIGKLQNYGETRLTLDETRWMDKNPDQRQAYIAWRSAYAAFLQTSCNLMEGTFALRRQVAHSGEVVRQLVTRVGWDCVKSADIPTFVRIAVQLVSRSLRTHKHSLVNKRRQTRCRNPSENHPGKSLCRHYAMACSRLCRFWEINGWEHRIF